MHYLLNAIHQSADYKEKGTREKNTQPACDGPLLLTYHESLAFRLFLMAVHVYNVH